MAKSYRSGILRGHAPTRVDRENGRIEGFSVITRGEAKGHGKWIDATALEQVRDHINSTKAGVGTRFTHPGICADAMGTQLGRTKNARIEDGVVRADFNAYKAVTSQRRREHLADVFDLAEEDPSVLGASIVFDYDVDEMGAFQQAHTNGEGKFASPDHDNMGNLPHARFAAVRYADIVGEPAANDGLFAFSAGFDLVDRGDAVLGFVLGVHEVEPDELAIGTLDVDRLRTFVQSYLERHDLVLMTGQQARTPATEVPAASPPQTTITLVSLSEEDEAFGAISYQGAHPGGTPLAPKGQPWDGPAQVAAADVTDLGVMCTWVDSANRQNKTAFKLPHHMAGGQHSCVWRGVAQAAGRLPQTFMPAGDRGGCRAHLARHYREFDQEPPWERLPEEWEVYEQFCVRAGRYGQLDATMQVHVLRTLGFSLEADALEEEPLPVPVTPQAEPDPVVEEVEFDLETVPASLEETTVEDLDPVLLQEHLTRVINAQIDRHTGRLPDSGGTA